MEYLIRYIPIAVMKQIVKIRKPSVVKLRAELNAMGTKTQTTSYLSYWHQKCIPYCLRMIALFRQRLSGLT